MIKLGNTDIEKVYLGANEINKAYLGNQVIFEKDLAPDYFAMTIDSTKPGTANNKFQFTGAQGEYDVDAVQNDVVQQSYTGLVDEQTITLPSAGTYQVRVKPTGTNPFNQIKFDRIGDKDKVLSIDSFGTVQWSSFSNAFEGCVNLTTSETNPDLSNVTNIRRMFRSTSSFNGNISGWNTSNITNMSAMFFRASDFNQDIGSWDTSNVTTMDNMFREASEFNQDIGGWDTSNVTTMNSVFYASKKFKQDISAWNVEQVTAMANMFLQVDMNLAGTTNYDNLLIAWSQQNVQQNVPCNFGDSKYSSAAVNARNTLINTYGWTISDAGQI